MINRTISNKLATAIEAAKIGADKALSYFNNGSDLQEKLKEDNTNVTLADVETEKVIKQFLNSRYPDDHILGEETGGSRDKESFWIIDPIDGTRIYARGINAWAVLISYFEKGEFKIGVCHFPLFGEIYYAERGKGAYLNGKKITVSAKKPLAKSLVNSGNPRNLKNKQIILDLVDKTAILRGHETTYADCLVASGKMDASIDPYAKLWDFASFAVILPEAGGKVTNLEGKPLMADDQGIIASNGLIHDEIIRIVNR